MGRETPFPSIADIGFVPAAVAAIWAIPSHSGAGDNKRRLLDGLTVTSAVALISWSTVLGPTVRAGGASLFAVVVSVVALGWCVGFALIGLGGVARSDDALASSPDRAVVPASVLP